MPTSLRTEFMKLTELTKRRDAFPEGCAAREYLVDVVCDLKHDLGVECITDATYLNSLFNYSRS